MPTAWTVDDVRAEKRDDELEIVDHQVEQDVDVERASGEYAEAVGLDVARLADEAGPRRRSRGCSARRGRPGGSGRVCGERDEPAASVDGRGDRLLDQHVDSRAR